MPIYEYRCEQCGEVFEILQKFSDEPAESCSHCSGHLTKLLSRSSFQLRGSGWYVSDYSDRYKNSRSAAASEKSRESSSSPSSSSSSASTAAPAAAPAAASAPATGAKSD